MLMSVLLFILGLLISIILPRLPLLIFPRLRAMHGGLEPFPSPQPIDDHLVAQLLILRTIWNTSFLLALIPLFIGFAILQNQPGMIAFGLFIGSGWTILSRVMPTTTFSFPNTPYSMGLIEQINELRVGDFSCCNNPELAWEVTAVRCRNCRVNHLKVARPDLGRVRTDGMVGRIRLLLLDGFPLVVSENKND
tara:strand:+ start:1638 stop:2216 length:579 start_codon:yes stop_codon:yes gene_type:complete